MTTAYEKEEECAAWEAEVARWKIVAETWKAIAESYQRDLKAKRILRPTYDMNDFAPMGA